MPSNRIHRMWVNEPAEGLFTISIRSATGTDGITALASTLPTSRTDSTPETHVYLGTLYLADLVLMRDALQHIIDTHPE